MSLDQYNQSDQTAGFGTENSGNYRMNPQTGTFSPYGSKAVSNTPQQNSAQTLQNTMNALMKGYVRKQDQPGGGLPLTSQAPTGITSQFGPVMNRFDSYGVPYTGYQYGQPQQQAGIGDPYSAMFSSPTGGSGGY